MIKIITHGILAIFLGLTLTFASVAGTNDFAQGGKPREMPKEKDKRDEKKSEKGDRGGDRGRGDDKKDKKKPD